MPPGDQKSQLRKNDHPRVTRRSVRLVFLPVGSDSRPRIRALIDGGLARILASRIVREIRLDIAEPDKRQHEHDDRGLSQKAQRKPSAQQTWTGGRKYVPQGPAESK